MKILSLDTSGSSISVSLLEDKKILGEFFLNSGFLHSKIIFSIVKKLIDITSIKIKDIDFLAVCMGPGSFTGIRIGTSFMDGIAFSLNKPCVRVSSLVGLAYSAYNEVHMKNEDEVIYSCMNANCNEIYFASYSFFLGKMHIKLEDTVMNLNKVIKIIKNEKKNITFVGSASKLCYDLSGDIKSKMGDTTLKSSNIGVAALDKFLSGTYSSREFNYLKKSKAESGLCKENIL